MPRYPEKTEFIPTNPMKCINSQKGQRIILRSGFERSFCILLDKHPNIEFWGSEVYSVPYFHPFKRKTASYIPDFVICYTTKDNKKIIELIEIKPMKEIPGFVPTTKSGRPSKVSLETLAIQQINACKFMAATAWAKKNGMTFRLMTEDQLYANNPGK